jgi:hypothetical protein
MPANLRDGGRIVIRLNVALDKLENSTLLRSYRHGCPSFLAVKKSLKTRFSLTSENRANILEQMQRDVKSFLSHHGFSPVIMIVPLMPPGLVGQFRMAAA